ncbi:hypothetical protein [Haliangium ochraceum]|uniref:DUF3311 domain-containing protein n=1 Tax=Haliangium ochraceum (strain DSM 14365 / JCM 11303 / SMP-2) TaxID=502025 RepID=D0LHL8_HALO1|nr:hypothetical protein [Haliangium ochraceum]ACY12880.1 hypothetical protein Hoch_0239 [Haliangium ochraceum DSM 14365]
MHDPDEVPRGLVLFAPDTPPAYRRRRLIFAALLALAAAAQVWPLYALFAAPRPFVLGMPQPLVWIISWMLLMFGALIWLYRSEPPDPADPPPPPAEP